MDLKFYTTETTNSDKGLIELPGLAIPWASTYLMRAAALSANRELVHRHRQLNYALSGSVASSAPISCCAVGLVALFGEPGTVTMTIVEGQ